MRTVRLVAACIAHAWMVVSFFVCLCVGMAYYVTRHFAMSTDTDALLSHELPWRVRQAAFEKAFSQNNLDIVVVVDGRTPELGEAATARLAARLGSEALWFHAVERPDSGPFWEHNRLLFASTEEVKKLIAQLVKVQPFLGSMASDPSLRGFADTLSLTMKGVTSDKPAPPELRTPVHTLADALQGLAAAKPRFFSWRTLITGAEPDERELRHVILVDPVLDFTQLQPAKTPIEAIRDAARQLELDAVHGVRVRLTGSAPLQDEEFATLAQRAGVIACLASGAVILMLWFAVRSPWLIVSILATTLVGLLTATALGLALFHRFNVISVAFIPLFVGMGIDLGIQFSVRYRAERHPGRDAGPALLATAGTMGRSLTLAATAIGIGFLAFAPTAYYGVSQLGMIAGLGLFAALALNLTLLPALIALARPPGAPARRSSERLTLLDDYILRHRRLVLGVAATAALISAVLLSRLNFDSNPMHLRSPQAESVATLADLMRDPDRSPNTLEVIRPSLAAANRLAAIFSADPTVDGARTLSSFIPHEQGDKIALISDAANLLDLTLNPLDVAAAPTDMEVVDSLKRAAAKLREAAGEDPSLRADARRLADELDTLARDSRSARARAEEMLIPGFITCLGNYAIHCTRRPSRRFLPPELVRQWQPTTDGHAFPSCQRATPTTMPWCAGSRPRE